MSAALHQDQYRAARRQAGEPAVRRGGAPSCIGHKFQLPGPPSRHGRTTFSQRPNSPAVHDAGRGFLFRGWIVAPDDLATFRTRCAAGLTPEQAAALDIHAGHDLTRQSTDLPERHVPSSPGHEQPDSEGFHGTVLYLSGELPKASGDHQHEFR